MVYKERLKQVASQRQNVNPGVILFKNRLQTLLESSDEDAWMVLKPFLQRACGMDFEAPSGLRGAMFEVLCQDQDLSDKKWKEQQVKQAEFSTLQRVRAEKRWKKVDAGESESVGESNAEGMPRHSRGNAVAQNENAAAMPIGNININIKENIKRESNIRARAGIKPSLDFVLAVAKDAKVPEEYAKGWFYKIDRRGWVSSKWGVVDEVNCQAVLVGWYERDENRARTPSNSTDGYEEAGYVEAHRELLEA